MRRTVLANTLRREESRDGQGGGSAPNGAMSGDPVTLWPGD